MKTVDTRFGPIQFDPSRTIVFTQGMIGFEHLKHFVLVPTEKDDFLHCLQSVEDGSVAFLLVDPIRYFPSYSCPITAQDRALLNVGPGDEVLVLTTITVHQDQTITLNLAAPVLLAPASSLAMQAVLEDNIYSPREPLPEASY